MRSAYVCSRVGRRLHGHPLVVEHVLRAVALFRRADHLLEQVEDLGRLCLPLRTREVQLSFLDLFKNFFVGITIERRVAAEDNVQDDAGRPDVALFVIGAFEHFRSNVERLGELRAYRACLGLHVVLRLLPRRPLAWVRRFA
jgi:hypothetical protein